MVGLKGRPGIRRACFASLILAICISVGVTLLALNTGLLSRIAPSSPDILSLLFAKPLDGPHQQITLIAIDEKALERKRCRSPVDRALLTSILKRLVALGPKVIGLDFILDLPDPNDAAFFDLVKHSTVPIVLGAVDDRVKLPIDQVNYQDEKLASVKYVGYLNLRTDADGMLRWLPRPAVSPKWQRSFAEEVVLRSGFKLAPPPARADRPVQWLRASGHDVFSTLTPDFLFSATDEQLARLINDRVILVGAQFLDQSDTFDTPLILMGERPRTGLEVHAQIAAQMLDKRLPIVVPDRYLVFVILPVAFLGILYGLKFADRRWPLTVPLLLPLVSIAAFSYWLFDLFLPILPIPVAWLVASWVGQVLLAWDKDDGIFQN